MALSHMHIVKLDAIDSTNAYLRKLNRELAINDDILVWAHEQTAGKGQMGAHWESAPGKNLTFSIYKRVRALSLSKQFYITMATSLAVYEVLEDLNIPDLSIKWPNDILAGKLKIAGILIEGVVRKNRLNAVVIGVGLNVNQTLFEYAPRATSLKLLMDEDFELKPLLEKFIERFHKYVQLVTEGRFEQLKSDYESLMFKKDKVSIFRVNNTPVFNGLIRGVDLHGKLLVEQEESQLKAYDIKEIEMLY